MENEEISGQEPRTGASWLWFLGGCALSVSTLCSVVLAALLLVSAAVNAYLAWTLSGYEVSISQATSVSTRVIVVTPTGELAVAPEEPPSTGPTITPTPIATSVPASTPTPMPTASTLEAEFATMAAIATQVADIESASTPSPTPTAAAQTPPQAASAPTPEAGTAPTEAAPPQGEVAAAPSASVGVLAASSNSYALIPIEGEREIRPAVEHGDLNLKLRDPQPAQLEPSLIDISNAGSDPNAPKLSAAFKPDLVATYAVHDWDWGCNCKGALIQDGMAVLVGINTTPGEPVFIPSTSQDIFQGNYYATLLYASEDSLTFVYARRGNVVEGYTIHYLGLQTDPNLLALFRESRGSELPGLTLDTPVGIATDELIVAVRDNGTFLDARSRLDWWN